MLATVEAIWAQLWGSPLTRYPRIRDLAGSYLDYLANHPANLVTSLAVQGIKVEGVPRNTLPYVAWATLGVEFVEGHRLLARLYPSYYDDLDAAISRVLATRDWGEDGLGKLVNAITPVLTDSAKPSPVPERLVAYSALFSRVAAGDKEGTRALSQSYLLGIAKDKTLRSPCYGTAAKIIGRSRDGFYQHWTSELMQVQGETTDERFRTLRRWLASESDYGATLREDLS